MKKLSIKEKDVQDRRLGVIALYKSGKYTTEQIAKNYGITPRSVQRTAKKAGIIRTLAESNKLMAPLKDYKKIPYEFRVHRKQITQKTRYMVISSHPYCTVCGMRPEDCVRLEVDHIDNDPSNNKLTNLQVLCGLCNMGKSHLDRFGP